jgi:hypothetical protein
MTIRDPLATVTHTTLDEITPFQHQIALLLDHPSGDSECSVFHPQFSRFPYLTPWP